MPKGQNQKLKLYYLARIMLEKTDDDHYLTMPEILEALRSREVTADRKSIYTDLRDLEAPGSGGGGGALGPILPLPRGGPAVRDAGAEAPGGCHPVLPVHHGEEIQRAHPQAGEPGQRVRGQGSCSARSTCPAGSRP